MSWPRFLPEAVAAGHLTPTATDHRTAPAPERVFGRGFDALFPDGAAERQVLPWPIAGRRKNQQPYDRDLVRSLLLSPVRLAAFDPRDLRATQPYIIRPGVEHYLGEAYRRTNLTYEPGDAIGNRNPVVYVRDGQAIILAGHHRASAALVLGRPLMARTVEGPWGPVTGRPAPPGTGPGPPRPVPAVDPSIPIAITPTLYLGDDADDGPSPPGGEEAARRIAAGGTVLVASTALARATLRALAVSPDRIDWLVTSALGQDRAEPVGDRG